MRPIDAVFTLTLVLPALASCVEAQPNACAGALAAAGLDAGAEDGGARDAGAKDAGAKDAGTKDAGACGACGDPLACGTVKSAAVRSASGIAASAIHDRIFYLHNGVLERPRFYAVDDTGVDRGSF